VRLEGLGKLKKTHLIGTRTRDLRVCSIVPQPTTLPLAPNINLIQKETTTSQHTKGKHMAKSWISNENSTNQKLQQKCNKYTKTTTDNTRLK
jgi:hypothetical protein